MKISLEEPMEAHADGLIEYNVLKILGINNYVLDKSIVFLEKPIIVGGVTDDQ